ncbi:DUF1963 domain-containing protein [Kitasatospora sp. NPDC056076]|uniref:DUF1963 domain-containing protein n=1 Tax=Kitasatospora sp. NPDC056076 TaxID=3345703 RepID=UPI0035D9D43A
MATLMIDNGPTAPDALVTRTGGLPLAPPGTAWPVCATCGGPMQFLAQVLLNDIDDGTGITTAPDTDRGVLALFACQNDPGMCEDWDPAAGGNRALLLPSANLQPLPLHEGADDAVLMLGAVRAVATEHDDNPDYNEAREAWAARTGHPDSSVLGQLGGTPAWIQGDETPACPQCARPMPLTVQLEEGPDHSTAMNFGTGGCAYAFTCEPCTQTLLLWQC